MKRFFAPGTDVLLPGAVFAGLAILPFVALALDQPFYIGFFARILIYAIAASALNLVLGYGGMVSLGHALFLGLGTYSVAILAHYGVDNGWIHLALCIAVCASAGFLTGMLSLRTTGIAFIMITLAFAQMGYFFFVSLKQYGGDDGMSVAGFSRFSGFSMSSATAVYAAALGALVLLTWWMTRLRVAPFGMVLRAGRENPRRVPALGLPLVHYQLTAYVISAVICGIAGLLLANLNAFSSPSTLSWMVSTELIVMVVLGGLGTAFGPVIGACAFIIMEELLKHYTDHWAGVFGLAMICMALMGKSGIMGLLKRTKAIHATPAMPALPVFVTVDGEAR